MHYLAATLPTLAENLACDESILEASDAAENPSEWWRLWESPTLAVVIGRSSKASEEVDLTFCRERQIPVVRRCSGGAAVVIGPGCLMFAAILSYHSRPELHSIDQAHRLVLGRIVESLGRIGLSVQHQGISDLTIGSRKISGNSLRCKRQAILYHGTLLYDFPLELVANCLRTAPRQPEYRAGRDHRDFVANLPVSGPVLRDALAKAWPDLQPTNDYPADATRQLARSRYACDEWTFRLM